MVAAVSRILGKIAPYAAFVQWAGIQRTVVAVFFNRGRAYSIGTCERTYPAGMFGRPMHDFETPALADLFRVMRPAVARFFAVRPGTDGRDVDDLVQTTFLEAVRSAPRFEHRSQVRTWLMGIAANVAKHHVRTEVRRREGLARYQREPRADTQRPDVVTESRRYLRRVPRALRRLTDDQRIACVLCAIDQVPSREASRLLNLPEGTLSRRVCEARRALASEIGRSAA